MATQAEAGAQAPRSMRRRASDRYVVDPAPQVAALVMALEQALVAAHHLLSELNTAASYRAEAVAPATSAASVGGLSQREAEVIGLLAAGKSNHQIAAALSLSPRTVQRHIANAYLKIGAHNKAEATAYALRHHLA